MKSSLKTLLITLLVMPFIASSLSAYKSIGQMFNNITRSDLIDLYDFPVVVTGPIAGSQWDYSATYDSKYYGEFPQQYVLALRLTGSPNASEAPRDTFMGFVQAVVNSLLMSGQGGDYGTIPYFRNYLDLTIKRFTDAGTSTEVDFDTATFRHVDADYNHDGIKNGWEPKPIIRGCSNVPLVGEVCLNMYLYDIDNGNPNGLVFNYDPNHSTFQFYPNEVSDRELSGIPSSSMGFSSDNPRSDDDVLSISLTLSDFTLDVLFEPPHYDQLSTTETVKDWEDDLVDDPATDLSNYLKATGKLVIPTFKLSLDLKILSTFNDEVYPRVVAIGFSLEDLELDTEIQLVLNGGPYCKSSNPGEDGLGVWAYVRADGTVNYNPPTDNKYNCDPQSSATIKDNGGPTDSEEDDSTYAVSTRLTEVIPFIEAQIRAYLKNTFYSKERPAPGYYFGPTGVVDISSMLAGMTFDDPLRSGTDTLQLELSLTSDVDLDGQGEFWADQWGVVMPFNVGIESLWYYGSLTNNTASAVTSCVWSEASFTGYQDGWLGNSKDDDPYLVPPLNLRYYYSNSSTDAFSGVLNGWQMPYPVKDWVITPGQDPMMAAGTYKIIDNYPPFYVSPFTYSIGLALHQNLLSMLIYDLAVKGVLCIDLDGNDPNNPLGNLSIPLLGSSKLLNTETFKMIFPALEKAFPDSVMRIRILPLFKNSPVPPDTASSFPNGVTAGYWGGYEFAPAIPPDVKVPFAIMGGPVIQAMAFDNLPHKGIAPDFSIVIPHLVVEFYVYDSNAGNILRRAFAIDLEIVLGLNIDILRPDMTPLPMTTVTENGNGGTVSGLQNPYVYKGTPFPIGCLGFGDNQYPCEFTAYTLRILRIAGLAKPRINAVIEYEEMSSALTTANAFDSTKVYGGALTNLFQLLLSSNLSGWAEVGIDFGALTGLPIALGAPYIGPSFVTSGTGNGSDGNISDVDQNGFGDYLEAGIGLYLQVTEPVLARFLLTQIDPLITGKGHSSLSNLVGGGGLSPSTTVNSYIPADGFPPETILEKPERIGVQTVFKVTAYDPDSQGEPILFSYRLDGGLWTPYLPLKEIKLNGLWEGKHVLEVKAMDMEGHREGTPVKYEFMVDTQAPTVHIIGKTLTDDSPVFYVNANDYITPAENIRISYSVDGSKWTPFTYDKEIELSGLSVGKHILAVKAVDEAGNVAEVTQGFVVEDSGFGCVMTSGSGSLANFLILLILPGLFLLVLRKKEGM